MKCEKIAMQNDQKKTNEFHTARREGMSIQYFRREEKEENRSRYCLWFVGRVAKSIEIFFVCYIECGSEPGFCLFIYPKMLKIMILHIYQKIIFRNVHEANENVCRMNKWTNEWNEVRVEKIENCWGSHCLNNQYWCVLISSVNYFRLFMFSVSSLFRCVYVWPHHLFICYLLWTHWVIFLSSVWKTAMCVPWLLWPGQRVN